jgi:hypothetical protein
MKTRKKKASSHDDRQAAGPVQRTLFADEDTSDQTELDLLITRIIDNIRSAPIPEDALL